MQNYTGASKGTIFLARMAKLGIFKSCDNHAPGRLEPWREKSSEKATSNVKARGKRRPASSIYFTTLKHF